MKYDMRTDPHVIEIDNHLREIGALPVIPDVLPSNPMTLDEVVEMFPHCWVLMGDSVRDKFGTLQHAVLKQVSYYKDDELEEYAFYHNLVYEYTTFGDGRNKCYRGYE